MLKPTRLIKQNLAIYFMILACLDFSLLGSCVKILSSELSSIEIMFFRNFICLFFIIYLLKKSKIHKEGGRIWLLIFRGLVGTLSLYLFFYNVSNINLGLAFAFQKISPIFISLIALVVSKEQIQKKGWLGIFLAFLGVVLTSHAFSFGLDLKNSLLGILSGFFAALALTSVRELRKSYSTEQIAFSFILIGSIMPFLSMIFYEVDILRKLDFLVAPFKEPSLKAWGFILIMGILGTIYQIHITKAYGIAKKASQVAGVSYLDVVFSFILGLFLGDVVPSFITILGVVFIVFGGLILIKTRA